MKRAALALALACGTSGSGRPFDGPDLAVGSISFHLASGAAVSGSPLKLVLSDQPDTCQALQHVSVQRSTTLSLKVLPAADGTTRATVVAKSAPGAGEATGALAQATGGVEGARYLAADGVVAWAAGGGGTTTITALDVGFAGASGRIALATPVTVPACP